MAVSAGVARLVYQQNIGLQAKPGRALQAAGQRLAAAPDRAAIFTSREVRRFATGETDRSERSPGLQFALSAFGARRRPVLHDADGVPTRAVVDSGAGRDGFADAIDRAL